MNIRRIVLIMFVVVSSNMAQSINITGVVKDSSTSSALDSVVVRLLVKGLIDTTDASGKFALKKDAVNLVHENFGFHTYTSPVFVKNGAIAFSVYKKVLVSIRTYSLHGALVSTIQNEFQPGDYVVSPQVKCSGAFVTRINIGNELYTLTFVNIHNKIYYKQQLSSSKTSSRNNQTILSKEAVSNIVDTLLITKKGYTYKKVPLDSLIIANLEVMIIKAGIPPKDPLFPNSVVSNDIDFITDKDPSAFESIKYIGQMEKEMPDRRPGSPLMDKETFVFEALFSNNKKIGLWAHSSFGSKAEAEKYANMLNDRLGKLPEVMRKELDHVVIHKGDETAFGEAQGHFFVLYSINMETRISNHDLEETVFHESVHATLEYKYQNDPTWLQAQKDDGAYITEYAKSKPALEDLPESALFAYTMLKHPGRLPSNVETWINAHMSNRLVFFSTLYH